jgi:Histidine kinase
VSPARSHAFDFRRAITWGTTWAIAVAVVEALAIHPPNAWGSLFQLLWWLLYWTVPFWCVVGAVYVWVAERNSAGLRSLISGFLIVSLAAAALQPPVSAFFMNLTNGILPDLERYSREFGITRPVRENWTTLGLYELWVTLFYGALLVITRTLTLRSERIRGLLHQNAMARSRTQALLDAARLQALQAQIDPSLLLDSMQELKQRYRSNPETAERLLEALVDFMRYAMHGLRAPVSTLSSELRLARAFAHLQRERGVGGMWHIVEDSPPDPQAYKFPSLLMLPLLALGADSCYSVLRVRTDKEHAVLSLQGITQSVSVELCQQIRSRLRPLYGDRFTVETTSTPQILLAITLRSNIPTKGEGNEGSINR